MLTNLWLVISIFKHLFFHLSQLISQILWQAGFNLDNSVTLLWCGNLLLQFLVLYSFPSIQGWSMWSI
jgi:hypothetical protein